MQKRRGDCVLYVGLLCLITLITHSKTARGEEGGGSSPVDIAVGVILDLDSSLGSVALNCTNIALQDFYSTHHYYSTRLKIHFRDSGKDLPTADSAAWDLINKEKVHAILGPINSEQARYVVELGNESNVSVIWFSPSGPSLLPPRSPYSINYNSARNHCLQFEAIVAIIKAYGWQCVIPIFEDPEFGNDLIPCLTYALQNMDTRVPYTSPIHQYFSGGNITKELNNIKEANRKCVFLAHMTEELWSRIVKHAQDEGMMSEGYAWILTQGLSSVIDPEAKGIKAKGYVDGALVVRPTLFVSNIRRRISLAETLMSKYDKTLSLYGLWAYDTVTALANAVENAGLADFNESTVDLRDKTGPRLRREILNNTDFEGVSGNFSLRKGRLEPTQVEVYNVKRQTQSIIGHWSPKTGLELFQKHSEVDELIWPGNTRERPVKLKVGLPRTHFTEFVNTNKSGLAFDVFERVVDVLPFNLSYEFVPVNISGEPTPSNYDDLLCNITNKTVDVDVIIGDITALVSRTDCVDFTLPFLDSSVSMVVKVGSDSKSVWVLFKPFDKCLWSILGTAFVVVTVVVLLLEKRAKQRKDAQAEVNSNSKTEDGDGKSKFQDFVHNPFLIYTSDIEYLNSGTSKWMVIVTTFLLGLIVQVYTAKLTSILTERTTPNPPPWKVVQEIKRMPEGKVGYQKDSWVRGLLIDKIGFDQNQLMAYASHREYRDALSNGSKKGGVDAIFDETPYLRLLLSSCPFCKITGPSYKVGGFAFAFRKNSTLVSSFSEAILNVTQNVTMSYDMMKRASLPVTVDKSEFSSDVEMRTLTKDDFGGLFSLALFVLILFFSLTILKVPSVALWLSPSLSNPIRSPFLWLHNKLISYFGATPA